MNYIKLFRGPSSEVEEQANTFLTDVAAKQHRVAVARPYWDGGNLSLMIVVNDEPHPHKLPIV